VKTVYFTDSMNLMCEESFAAALDFLNKSRGLLCTSLRIPVEMVDDLLAEGSLKGA